MDSFMNINLQKIGDLSQLAGIREVKIESGSGKGMKAYEVHNAAGLRFTVIPDKCLDIHDCSYKGTNLSFISKNGLVSNTMFDSADGGFVNYWSAGLLCTCGLDNAGPPCDSDGNHHVRHGRIGMQAADWPYARTQWVNGDFELIIEGEIRQSMLFGMNLKLKRTIKTSLFSKRIVIKDVLENLEPSPEDFMILYHFNLGYPLLDEGSRIVKPEGAVKPRDQEADIGLENAFIIEKPEGNSAGQVFFHDNKADLNGLARVGLINEKIGLGAYIEYGAAELPILTEWKCRRPHDYVLGLEPGNSYIMGRRDEKLNGTLKSVNGYSSITFDLCFGVLDGAEEMIQFEKDCL